MGAYVGLSSHSQEQGSRSCSLTSQCPVSPYHSASLGWHGLSLCFKGMAGLHQRTAWPPLNARPSENTDIHYAADGETSAMLLGRAAAVYLFSVPTTPTVYMFSRLFQLLQLLARLDNGELTL